MLPAISPCVGRSRRPRRSVQSNETRIRDTGCARSGLNGHSLAQRLRGVVANRRVDRQGVRGPHARLLHPHEISHLETDVHRDCPGRHAPLILDRRYILRNRPPAHTSLGASDGAKKEITQKKTGTQGARKSKGRRQQRRSAASLSPPEPGSIQGRSHRVLWARTQDFRGIHLESKQLVRSRPLMQMHI